MKPQLLSQSRYTAAASLSPSVSVPLSSNAAVIVSINNLVTQLPKNSLVRIAILRASMATDAGGVKFLTIQNARLGIDGGLLATPAFSGSPLGLVNGATFQGEIRFHDVDLPDSTFVGTVNVSVSNSDSTSAHSVTNLDVVLLVEIATFDQPVYADGLVGI